MDEVRGSLEEAGKQLMAIGTLYEADLDLQRVSPTLRGKIKAFLANERSALDHLAQRVVAAHGTTEAHTHYPFAAYAAGFEASVDKNMPGVRDKRPGVAEAIARHQPYSVPALAQLRDLLNDESTQRLAPETHQRLPGPSGPAEREAPGPSGPPEREAQPGEAGASMAPGPPPANAGGMTLSGGLFINGIEYDPTTLQRQQEAERRASKLVYVAWRFGESGASALADLEAIDAAVRSAVDEVSASAGLTARSD